MTPGGQNATVGAKFWPKSKEALRNVIEYRPHTIREKHHG
jgi:hypothetical protein